MGLSTFAFTQLAKLQGGEVSGLYDYKRNLPGYGPPCSWGRDFMYSEPTVRQLSLTPTREGKVRLHALTDTNYFGNFALEHAHMLKRVDLGEVAARDGQKILHRFNKACKDNICQGYGEGIKLYQGYFEDLPEGSYTPVGKPDLLHWRTHLVRRLGSLDCVVPEQRLSLVLTALHGRLGRRAESVGYERARRLARPLEAQDDVWRAAFYKGSDKARALGARMTEVPKLEFTPPQS